MAKLLHNKRLVFVVIAVALFFSCVSPASTAEDKRYFCKYRVKRMENNNLIRDIPEACFTLNKAVTDKSTADEKCKEHCRDYTASNLVNGTGYECDESSLIVDELTDKNYCKKNEYGVPVVRLENPAGKLNDEPAEIIGNILIKAMEVVGALAFAAFIFGGFLWMTSAGKEDQVRKGAQSMIWATVGLLVIFASYAILRTFFTEFIG